MKDRGGRVPSFDDGVEVEGDLEEELVGEAEEVAGARFEGEVGGHFCTEQEANSDNIINTIDYSTTYTASVL